VDGHAGFWGDMNLASSASNWRCWRQPEARLALNFPTRISLLRLGSSRESARRWDAKNPRILR